MGKLLPIDYTSNFNSTDIVCYICRSAFGGLIYDVDRDAFRHRDGVRCMARRA